MTNDFTSQTRTAKLFVLFWIAFLINSFIFLQILFITRFHLFYWLADAIYNLFVTHTLFSINLNQKQRNKGMQNGTLQTCYCGFKAAFEIAVASGAEIHVAPNRSFKHKALRHRTACNKKRNAIR